MVDEIVGDVEKFRVTLEKKHHRFEGVDAPNAPYQIARELCDLFGFKLYCYQGLADIRVTDFTSIFVKVPADNYQHP